MLTGCEFGSSGEGNVVGFQEGLSHVNRRAHDDRVGPKLELHDGPIFLGECMDRPVGKLAYKVEVSNDGPGFWTGRQIELAVAEAAGEEDESECSQPCGSVCNPRNGFHYCGTCCVEGLCGVVFDVFF